MLGLHAKASVWALVCAAFLPLTQDTDLSARVKELEKLQQQTSADALALRARVEALERWQKSTSRQAEELQRALQGVDAAGFTKAGVNASAREQLLQGLKSFGAGLATPLPPAK
jgi:uncharacterized protein YpbB